MIFRSTIFAIAMSLSQYAYSTDVKPNAFVKTYSHINFKLPTYDSFCSRFGEQCGFVFKTNDRIDLTLEKFIELDHINRYNNSVIKPIADDPKDSTYDYWTIPHNGKGDCEDYVLAKRAQLMAHGWPANVLLITVVLDQNGNGHAVLMIRAKQGDFIIDNMNDEIKPWHKTGYKFRYRQSSLNTDRWIALYKP